MVVAFSLHALAVRRHFELKDDRLAGFFGFTAGVLGGAYGINGPPLAIYGTLRRWSPEHFRAMLQAYFLPASLAGWAAIGSPACGPSRRSFIRLAAGRPGGDLSQSAINQRMWDRRFLVYIHVALTAIGTVLLLKAFRGMADAG